MKPSNLLSFFKRNQNSLLLLLLLVFVGLIVRLNLLETHFTHIDDVGVAKTIVERQKYMTKIESQFPELKQKVLNGSKGDSLRDLALFLDKKNILEDFAYGVLWWRNILHAVPNGWTYAPGQFYFTNLLINSELNYSEYKFYGRLPSAIFNLVSVLLVFSIFRSISKEDSSIYKTIIFASIVIFSLQNIIYSAQMESYAIIHFAMLLGIILAIKISENPIVSVSKNIKRGVILVLPGLFHYQALIPLIPLILATFFHLRKSINTLEYIKGFFFTGIGFLISFALFLWPYFKGVMGSGINWNGGPNKEFIFNIDFNQNFLDIFHYIFSFFITNFIEVLGVIHTPYENVIFSQILGTFIAVISLYGIYLFIQSKISTKKFLGLYLILLIITWIILVIYGAFPLSPTRHSMALTAIFLVPFSEGLLNIFEKIQKWNIDAYKILISALLVGWVSIFSLNYHDFQSSRKDPFDEAKLIKKLNHDKVDIVLVLDSTENIYLMNELKNNFPILHGNEWTLDGLKNIHNLGKELNLNLNPNRDITIALLSSWVCREELRPEHQDAIFKFLNKKQYSGLLFLYADCIDYKSQVGLSMRTQNGTNSFNYSIFKFNKR